jgi:DNA recombination protein RmuC
MLDDVLPPGGYETNCRMREDSREAVEFAIVMPMRGQAKTYLPIDAKFPVADYERLLTAAEAGDAEAERTARRALERCVRDEAKKISSKYISPPATAELGVMYLPSEGLYAEVARIPGLIDDVRRASRVLVMGPTLFHGLLRMIQLSQAAVVLEQKAEEVRSLLGATRTEMLKMDDVLDKLGRQAGTFSRTIEDARRRTRAVDRKLRDVELIEPERAAQLLEADEGQAELALAAEDPA